MNRHQLAINIKPDGSEANMQGVAGALRKKQNGPTQVLMSRRIATKVSGFVEINGCKEQPIIITELLLS